MSLPLIGLAGQEPSDGQLDLRRISAQGPSNSTLAKADYKMTKAHRASMGTIYFPGDVAWSLDDADDAEEQGRSDAENFDEDGAEEYVFPWW